MAQTSITAEFVACVLRTREDILADMSICDKPVYEWLLQYRTVATLNDLQTKTLATYADKVATDVSAAIDEYRACEAGNRATSTPAPSTTLKVYLQTKGVGSGASDASGGLVSTLQVPFAPSNITPEVCQKLPYMLLHTINEVGLSTDYSRLSLAFTEVNNLGVYGEGPWEGMRVVFAQSSGIFTGEIYNWVYPCVRLEAKGVLTTWATVKNIPGVPEGLLARSEALDLSGLSTTLQDPVAKWIVSQEFYKAGVGLVISSLVEFPVESPEIGETTADIGFEGGFYPELSLDDSYDLDGNWTKRVAVIGLSLAGTPVVVRYAGQTIASPLVGLANIGGYIPGGRALVECKTDFSVITWGNKIGMRLQAIGVIPGLGLYMTLSLLNPYHIPACIVAGLFGHEALISANLPPGGESPTRTYVVGWSWRVTDIPRLTPSWNFNEGVGVAYPINSFQDGIHSRSEINMLGGYVISGGMRATLERWWYQGTNYGAYPYDPSALVGTFALSTLPIIGGVIPYNLTGVATFTVYERWGTDPVTWEAREYQVTLMGRSFDMASRYGQSIRASLGDAVSYIDSNNWHSLVLSQWAGGNSDELGAYLAQKYYDENDYLHTPEGGPPTTWEVTTKPRMVVSTNFMVSPTTVKTDHDWTWARLCVQSAASPSEYQLLIYLS